MREKSTGRTKIALEFTCSASMDNIRIAAALDFAPAKVTKQELVH